MTLNKNALKLNAKAFFMNTFRFAFTLLFISLYAYFFGQVNLLPSIAVVVAIQTFPVCNMEIKASSMTFLIFFFFTGSGLVTALSLLNPWVGLVLNFTFIALIMVFSAEPSAIKPHIIFLLGYIFCQSSPVAGHDFVLRMVSLTASAAVTAAATALFWKIKGFDASKQRNLKEQFRYCLSRDRGFILRMAVGLAAAMFIGAALGLKKPLWISIVVMSLTQIDFSETLTRIRHRSAATLVGIILFVLLFQVLIPDEYGSLLILFFGYIGNYQFAKPYKYQQVINFMSALFASLIFLDLTTAIINRVLCLVTGILIVVMMRNIESFMKKHLFSLMEADPEN